jgi:hypothetical protein
MHIPICIGVVKVVTCRRCNDYEFFTYTMFITVAVAVGVFIVFGVWLNSGDNWWFTARKRLPDLLWPVQDSRARDYDLANSIWNDYNFNTHCPLDILRRDNITLPGKEPRRVDADLRAWCQRVSGVAFYIWGGPVALGLCSLVTAACCGVMRMLNPEENQVFADDDLTLKDKVDLLKRRRTEANVRILLGVTAGFIFIVYISSMLTGSAMRMLATVRLFLGVFGAMAVGFFAKNLRPEVLEQASQSKMVKNLIALSKMDPVRALVAAVGGILFPFLLGAGYLKQRVRLARDPSLPRDTFSPTIQRVYNAVMTWHPGGVMSWMVKLSLLIFALDICAKLAYVILSYLGEAIAELSVVIVSLILSFVGFLVFMNPLMPGPVVYMVVGVVVTGRLCRGAKADAGLDVDAACPNGTFVGGLFLCTTLCFLTKLAAVCGQMEIGRLLGQRVTVQRMCQVDKPAIRAIELILRKPGLFPGKVAILCGGPDWPTSVLCGILRQSKAEMCFGTCPMFFVCMPSVLSGAILNMPPGGMWGQATGLALIGMMLSQTLIMLVATFYINEYCGSDDPEILKILNEARPEHAAVEELSRKSAAFESSFGFVTRWSQMTGLQRALLLVGTAGSFLTAMSTAASSKTFFRPFSATSRIDAPYDNEPPGLNGDARNLVRSPQGWICIAVHYASFLVFYMWGISVGKSATAHMSEEAGGNMAEAPESPEGGRTESGEVAPSDS